MLRATVFLAAGVLMAACGGEASRGRIAFSQVEVQAYLEREVARTLPGLAVGAATCPPKLPDRVGDTATCTVMVERVGLDYQVQRLVADRFEARPSRPVVVVSDVAEAVKAKLGPQAADVRCGAAKVAQPAAGQPLSCRVTGEGKERTAVVRVGADGTLIVTDT